MVWALLVGYPLIFFVGLIVGTEFTRFDEEGVWSSISLSSGASRKFSVVWF